MLMNEKKKGKIHFSLNANNLKINFIAIKIKWSNLNEDGENLKKC